MLVSQGNLTEALKYFRDSLAIRERLAKTDPSNAVWLRDLAFCHGIVGCALAAQGNLTEALKYLRGSLAIRERLVTMDPNNAVWRSDLAFSYVDVGGALLNYGDLAEAQGSLRRGLTILKQLNERGQLEPRQRYSITVIEAELAKLQEAEAAPR